MSAAGSSAKRAPERLVDLSEDVRSAVLVDSAGALVAASDPDTTRARKLAELTRELIEAADAVAAEPTEQIEARVEGGAVFAVRTVRHTLACVARRLALPALVLYDLRQTLQELEGWRDPGAAGRSAGARGQGAMREPAKGAIGRATAVAEGVAAGVRRRQREREPRVLLFARPGEPRVLAPGAKGQDRILTILAEKMVALVDEADGGTRRDRARARRASHTEERASRRAAREAADEQGEG